MSKLAETAIAAYRKREEDRARKWADGQAIYDEQEREKDAEALELVSRSPLAEWFPDVKWALCDRKFPQASAVVTSEDDADDGLWFRVTCTSYPEAEHTRWLVSIVKHMKVGSGMNPWRELCRVECPADVGDWLEREKRGSGEVAAVSR